jgi:protein phosphatase
MALGTLDAAARERHPMRNVLTQAIGSQTDVDVHTRDLILEPADLLLLTTDGLHAVIGDGAVYAALDQGGHPEQIATHLINQARAAGGPDNISCVVIAADA